MSKIPIPSISSISDNLSDSLEGIDRPESESPVLVDIPHEFAQGWPPRIVDQNMAPPMECHAVPPPEGPRLIQDPSDISQEPVYEHREEPGWGYYQPRYPKGLTSPAPTVPTPLPPDTNHRSHTVAPAPSSSTSSIGAGIQDGVRAVVGPSSPRIEFSISRMAPHSRSGSPYYASSRSDSPEVPVIPPMLSIDAIIQVPQRSYFSAISDGPPSSRMPEVEPPRAGSISPAPPSIDGMF